MFARKLGFDLFTNKAGVATHVDELFLMFKSHKLPIASNIPQ